MRKSAADKILEAREKRAELIDEMIKEFKKPLLVMRVNYPGLNKSNELTIGIMEDMDKVICETLGSKAYKKTIISGIEGPILYMVVSEDVIILKQITIELEENHILGRCLDIDIYDVEGKSISRKQLGYEVRKCYLCNDYAQNCVRAKVHSEEEVIAFIKKRYKEYMEYRKENCRDYSINIASHASKFEDEGLQK
jgi:holo-ACP synthase CitX